MEKQQKHLIIAVAALVVLIAAYFGVKTWSEKKAEAEAAADEAAKTYITDFEVSDISGFSYDYEDVHYEYSLVDGTWVSENDETLTMDTEKIETVLAYLNNIEAGEVLEGVEDVSEYGIDEPVNVIGITLSSGEEYTITVGSYNSLSQIYYAMVNDDENVYTISSSPVTKLKKTNEDFCAEEETTEESTEETTEETTIEETTEEDTTSEETTAAE